jgi:hypothetical protein
MDASSLFLSQCFMRCVALKNRRIFIEPITGEKYCESDGSVNPIEENKENNCKYFEKKFFTKKSNLILCKNCKNWQEITGYC